MIRRISIWLTLMFATINLYAQTEVSKRDSLFRIEAVKLTKQIEHQRLLSAQDRFLAYSANLRLDTLIEINLTDVGLTSLPDFVLEATQLQVLILDNNTIQKLPRRLTKLDSLEKLYWRANKLADRRVRLPKLNHLQKLDFSDNQLTQLPEKFKRLDRVVELVLDGNSFEEVPIRLLSKMDSLKELSIGNCTTLKLADAEYEKLSELRKLKVTKAELTDFHPAIYRIPKLEELHLSYNQFQTIPSGISQLKHLRVLSFYRNSLEQLPEELFLLNLESVDLYYNQLDVIPESIGKWTNLKILYLANNRIYSLPESLGQLRDLKEVYLHHNRLTSLPASMSQLQQVEVFRVNANYLVDFPQQVLAMTKLRDLDLSANAIEYIPAEIEKLSNLRLFTFQENPLDFDDPKNQPLGPVLWQMKNAGVIVVPDVHLEN